MPEVNVKIGARSYKLVCDPGQEGELKSAAAQLDKDAQALIAAGERLPEERVLLLSGLMTADRVRGLEWEVQSREERIAELEARLKELETKGDEPDEAEIGLFENVELQQAMKLLEETAQRLEALAEGEAAILAELKAVQGPAADIGGYYKPSVEKKAQVMRPSATLNAIIG